MANTPTGAEVRPIDFDETLRRIEQFDPVAAHTFRVMRIVSDSIHSPNHHGSHEAPLH